MTRPSLLKRRNRLVGAGAPLFYEEPLHFVCGEGVWLFDAKGRRYLDTYNNVPNVGHCHPRVVEALANQAGTLNVHTRYLSEVMVAYGEDLVSRFDPTLSMLFLTCSGSESNDLALRMARQATGRQGIICTNATYHGNTTAVDALSTMFRDGQPGSAQVKAIDFPETYRPLDGLAGDALIDAHLDQLRRTIDEFEQEGTGFAGLLVCPIFANEGLPNVPDRLMARIAAEVRKAGGLLIFDEVQSSFGRTGRLWGHELVGVVPDLVTLGKPMGNGHPLAGVICRPEIGNGFREQVMYFNTFGGNPVSCAVGHAVLKVIDDEGLVENAASVGTYVHAGLQTLASRHALIGDIRGHGLFFGVELVTDRAAKTPATDEARRIVNAMARAGVLISAIGRASNVLKIRPPICFAREHADLLLETLGATLAGEG